MSRHFVINGVTRN